MAKPLPKCYNVYLASFNCTLQQTFHYDSPYWTDKNEYGVPEGETGLDRGETKLATYWNTPFTKICLGMAFSQEGPRFIVVNQTASSLFALIGGGNFHATTLGRDEWKELIGHSQASLQVYCNREGFNVRSDATHSKARIGIISNQENHCRTCDSRIGFGTGGKHDNSNTCGNQATHSPDNGNKHIKAFGYILVQWGELNWTVQLKKNPGANIISVQKIRNFA